MRDAADVEPGESWAYRARGVDLLVEVVVVCVGTRKPARVLVRFVDDEFEGREQWVPPVRLKVPWSEVADIALERSDGIASTLAALTRMILAETLRTRSRVFS